MKKIAASGITLLSVFALVACSTSKTEPKKADETTTVAQVEKTTVQEETTTQAETTNTTEATSSKTESTSTTELSREQKNALRSAEQYLEFSAFSKEGLYDQLIFEKYPDDAAHYAIDNVKVDWNEQALKSAQSYLDFMAFSDAELYDQLIFEKFTAEQAQYAIDHLDE